MKEKHFCRCCLSEECYKDMDNTYYIGDKTENYFEMLVNIFNVNLRKDDAKRSLICEECVSKLRDGAAFKKKVLDVQESIKNNLSWHCIGSDIDTNLEEDDYFDDFNDNISETDILWENFTDDGSQKGQVFFITLNSFGDTQNRQETLSKHTKSKYNNKEIEQNKNLNIFDAHKKDNVKNTNTFGAKEKDTSKNCAKETGNNLITLGPIQKDENASTLGDKEKDKTRKSSFEGTDTDDFNIDGFDTDEDFKLAEKSRKISKNTKIVAVKTGTATKNKDKLNIGREKSQTETVLKYKSENTLKLIQNSNLCLFRSLRNKFGCNYCPLTFSEFIQLREHSLSHKNPRMSGIKRLRGLSCKNADISDLKCNICSQNCTDLENLMDHLKKEHEFTFHGTGHYLVPYKLQDGNQCVLCELKFNTYLRLITHMNSHYKNNVCEKCGLSFINRIGLRTHVQSQHQEKKCPRCPAIFLTAAAKSKHLRQAHGIWNAKRYCNICSKSFKHNYMLKAHKIKEHGAKKPEPSICVLCGKKFMSHLNLKTHIRSVHVKERNFPCSKCGMRFFTSCDQRRHERTHEDVRSFSCHYCDAKFKSKDSWRRHLKRQHGHVFGKATTT